MVGEQATFPLLSEAAAAMRFLGDINHASL
jgi:hypothetical protein